MILQHHSSLLRTQKAIKVMYYRFLQLWEWQKIGFVFTNLFGTFFACMYITYMQNIIQTASLHHCRSLPNLYLRNERPDGCWRWTNWMVLLCNRWLSPTFIFSPIIEWLSPYFLKHIEHQINWTYILSFIHKYGWISFKNLLHRQRYYFQVCSGIRGAQLFCMRSISTRYLCLHFTAAQA